MAVVEFKNERGVIEFHVNNFPGYKGFDELRDFLVSMQSAELIEEKDGPGTKLALLKVEGEIIRLVFSDLIGNYFYAVDDGGSMKAREVARAIAKHYA